MTNEQLKCLGRKTLLGLKADLELESVSVRQRYAVGCRDLVANAADWAAEHTVLVAERDAALASVKYKIRSVNVALGELLAERGRK